MSLLRHPLTIEDALYLKSASDAQISPDGALVAFTVADTFKVDTEKPKSQIWLAAADGSFARPFTAGSRTDEHPRWSPDGQTLAFLSDRVQNGKPQVYLLRRGGGEAELLTEAQGKVLLFEWSPDGRQIALLMEDAETDEEKKRKAEKDDAIEFERRCKYARVWVVDVAHRDTRQVTFGNVHVWEFNWSPAADSLALIVADAPFEYEWYRSRLARVSLQGGIPETVWVPERNKQLALPRWSPDGTQIAFVSSTWSDRDVVAGDLWTIRAGGESPRNLTARTPRDVSSFEWIDGGRALLVMGYEKGESAIGTVSARDGAYRQLWSGQAAFMDRLWQHFSLSRDNSLLAAVREDPLNPPDAWLAAIGEKSVEWRQLSHLNPQAEGLKLGETVRLEWQSRDGITIQGYLVKPVGYQERKRYPLVVWVHGGPASLYSPRYYALNSRVQLLAAHGMMVLLPNPRGSVGWGTAFTESNVGDLGGMDWQDILAGVDYCLSRGFADENRLGLAGWSYGGFMTAWGITQTDRFKAALMGAGISNWLSFHGTSNLPVWDAFANAVNPFEGGGAFKSSAMDYIGRAKTPTLVMHGQDDPYVPVGQGYEVFRALKELGVETEMVVYPREAHGILEKNHQIDLMRRTVEWFERHL